MAPNSEAHGAIYLQTTWIRITAPIPKIWCFDVPQSLLVCCKFSRLFLYSLSHSYLLFGSPLCYWPFSGSLASLMGDLRLPPNLPHDIGAIRTSDFSLPRTICIPYLPGSKNSWGLKAGTEGALSKYLWNARMNGYMKSLHDRISAVMGDRRGGFL